MRNEVEVDSGRVRFAPRLFFRTGCAPSLPYRACTAVATRYASSASPRRIAHARQGNSKERFG